MKKYIFYNNGFTFERITKREAFKAYKNNLTIILCACNMRPFTPWHPEQEVNKKDREAWDIYNDVTYDFNSLINSFEYYNCNNETGKYTAFYIPVKPVDAFTGGAITYETTTTTKEYDYNFMNK